MTAPAAVEPRTVTITLPLPPEALSPNARVHMGTKAKATKQYRQDAAYAAIAERNQRGITPMQRATLAIRYVVCPNNPLGNRGKCTPKDQDNAQAACKAAIDGIVRDARLLPDDNTTRLTTTTTLERHRKGQCAANCGGSRVEFTFTEVR